MSTGPNQNLTKSSLKKWLDEAEESLNRGEIAKVSEEILAIPVSALPTELRLPFAKTGRRLSMSSLSLQALSPVILQRKGVRAPTVQEIAEYCMNLREAGAIDEAQLRINQVESGDTPETLLCEMFLAFSFWDSQRVVESADHYLKKFGSDDYQSGVVLINKAAGLLGLEKFEEAKTLLLEAISEFQVREWPRLLANSHELLAQIYIQAEQFDRAIGHLEFAKGFSDDPQIKDSLFIKRWEAVIKARQSGDPESLIQLKPLARQMRHHETLRSIDYECLRVKFDKPLYDKLFFGTPFPFYRKILEGHFGEPSTTYHLGQGERELHLQDGRFQGRKIFGEGTNPIKLLSALASDFYRPATMGSLFNRVFDSETFDPHQATNRVHQLIYRTRRPLEEIGIHIVEMEKSYFLQIPENTSIVITRNLASRRSQHLNTLRDLLGEAFSPGDAEKALTLSRASTYRILKHGLETNVLIRSGFGPNTSYRFHDPE